MSSKDKIKNSMEAIVSLCKRRGFIYQSSELYGGINGFWDYGPLGSELKRNVRDSWWRSMVHLREDMEGLDATIIMHPDIWRASGHIDGFADPLVDCKECRHRFRADQLCEESGLELITGENGLALPEGIKCTNCGAADFTEPRSFNLMFKTFVGPVEDENSVAYLRPETAQAIFAQFKNVLDTTRQSIPFGIAQIGKSFRNEINPRNFTFRSREFEQMEVQYFIRPDEAIKLIFGDVAELTPETDLGSPQGNWGWKVWHAYWTAQRKEWYRSIGLPSESLHEYWQSGDELAHYAKTCVDIEYDFPFGIQELEGIAARGDYDLTQHQRHSGKNLEVFDEPLKLAAKNLSEDERKSFRENVAREWGERGVCAGEADEFVDKLFDGRYLPHVVEPSAGVDRIMLALLCNAYDQETLVDGKGKEDIRTVMRFHPKVAPIKVAVLPLVRNKPELLEHARGVFEDLRRHFKCSWDATGAIGRRYRRQDEAGTPFCLTVDFETLEDGTVTIRERDTMEQERVSVAEFKERLDSILL